jgi:hypothetical protein
LRAGRAHRPRDGSMETFWKPQPTFPASQTTTPQPGQTAFTADSGRNHHLKSDAR